MKPYVTLIDNYDSFTYNVMQYCAILGAEVNVIRNDTIMSNDLPSKTTHIIISPGPGTPSEAGASNEIIHDWADKRPILGVCLGHQCIGEVFGGKTVLAKQLMHGKISAIQHDGKGIFTGIPENPFSVVRYHSLVTDRAQLPDCLTITACLAATPEGDIMAVRHKTLLVEGVQFHPEAYYTKYGFNLFKNFLGQQT